MSSLTNAINRKEDYFEISDDREARAILLELGIFDQFGEAKVRPEPTVRIVRFEDLDSHSVFGMCYIGFHTEERSGYYVRFFRKDKHTPKEISGSLATLFSLSKHTVEYVNRKSYDKEKN